MGTSKIKVYASNDDAVIVWRYPKKITNCCGFAVYRKRKGETDANAEPLLSSVGFEGDDHVDGEQRPTTIWPLQRYMWTDYYVKQGDEVCYKVVPMIMKNGTLVKDTGNETIWSTWTKIDNSKQDVYFTRGLVSSQFVAKYMAELPGANKAKPKIDDELKSSKSPLREFMGGTAVKKIHEILELVKNNKSLQVYGALYELNEDEMIKRLNLIGKRAHIILANGAFGADDDDPEAKNAKKLNKVDLTRRKVKSGHFAHNKFLVVTDSKSGKEIPILVLTGSTNWTLNGLYKQVNNVIVFTSKKIAGYYMEEWNALLKDCKGGIGMYAAPFKTFNATVKQDGNVRTWFQPVKGLIDMNDAEKLLRSAKEGILFLMFKPGNVGKRTLYNEIVKIAKAKPDLLVHGVINVDPGGKKAPTITFMHKGKMQKGSFEGVVKGNINNSFEFWLEELGSPNVTIHSKLIVVDPFSANPVVMTGSYNMGEKASRANDDNLNIVTKDNKVAEAYAVHVMSVYHHFRWRYYRNALTNQKKWDGNIKDDKWQDWYKSGNNKKELDFWS